MNNNQKIKATDCNTLKVPKSYGIRFSMESLSQMLFGLKVLFPILALLQMILFATALVFVKHTVVYTLFIMSLVVFELSFSIAASLWFLNVKKNN
jgi:hypothetical protein